MRREMFVITVIFSIPMLVLLFSSVFAEDSYANWTAIIGMIVILFCPLLSWLGWVETPWPLVLAVDLSIFLHNLGLARFTRYYYETQWWDDLMHLVSTIILSVVVVCALLVIERYSKTIKVPRYWYPFFVFIMVMMVGVSWEVFEYAIDQVFATDMQHSLDETLDDLVSDVAGGLIGGIVAVLYLRMPASDRLIRSLGFKDNAIKIERWFNKRAEMERQRKEKGLS
jgi:hypothetical protein